MMIATRMGRNPLVLGYGAKMSVEYAIPGFVYGIRLCFIFPMANPPFGEFIGNIWEYVLFV